MNFVKDSLGFALPPMYSPGLRSSDGHTSEASTGGLVLLDPPVLSVLPAVCGKSSAGDVGKPLQRKLSCGTTRPVFIMPKPGMSRGLKSQGQTLVQKRPCLRQLEG